MPEFAQLGYFIITSSILIIAPGPDIIFLISQSIHKGSHAGLLTAIGLTSGNLIHTLIAAAGISALILNSPIALSTIKFVGVGYLLFLAYETICNNTKFSGNNPIDSHDSSLFLRGLLMNLLNPKRNWFADMSDISSKCMDLTTRHVYKHTQIFLLFLMWIGLR